MAWTDPRTWVTGEIVTAALLNTHIRDNMDALRDIRIIKNATQTETGTTLQADDDFTFPVAANEKWIFQINCVLFAATDVDAKFAMSGPSGLTHGVWGFDVTYSTAGVMDTGTNVPIDGTSEIQHGTVNVLQGGSASIAGHIINGANAGFVTLLWAKFAAGSSSLDMRRGSWLLAHQIA